jgi:hypothetical protein
MATWEFEKIECYVRKHNEVGYLPVFRAFDGSDHFYTTDEAEYQSLPASYQRHGKSFHIANSAINNHIPLYKLYHPETVDHFFTTSQRERDNAVKKGFEERGVLGYVVSSPHPQHVPLFRAYHPDLTDHFYTTDEAELEVKGSPTPGSPATIEVDTGFDPNEDGYLFRNSFRLEPDLFGLDLGGWDLGFCGGMSLSAVRAFNTVQKLSRRKTIPRQGEGLFDKLLKWQIETVPPHIISKVHLWQSSLDQSLTGFTKSIGKRTKDEWPKIKAELDRKQPVVLTLIRVRGFFGNITKNHQVVAIGYKTYQNSNVHSIQIYDPNWPEEKGEIVFTLGLRKNQINAHQRPRRPGHTVRGFFLNHKG